MTVVSERVTEMFQRYRMCLRQIWNGHVWSDPELQGWDAADRFEQLKPIVFRLIVEDRFTTNKDGSGPLFSVVPCVPGPDDTKVSGNVIVLKKDGSGLSYDT